MTFASVMHSWSSGILCSFQKLLEKWNPHPLGFSMLKYSCTQTNL